MMGLPGTQKDRGQAKIRRETIPQDIKTFSHKMSLARKPEAVLKALMSAHELRTPLTSIVGFTTTLLADGSYPAEHWIRRKSC
jgi:signal transduction histidine kinase